MTWRCWTPRNDQRPTRCPPSADSSRNDGPLPRSLRYAETGVSVSAMNVWRSGTTVWSRASARASSKLGWMSSAAVSAATGIELLVGIRERQPARGQQHREVVENVCGLGRQALIGLVRRRARQLFRLLLHLRGDPRRLGQKLRRVAARLRWRRAARGDRPLERRQRLVRRERLGLAVVEAGALARVAGGPSRLDEREHGIAVAVVAQLADALDVARGLPLVPQLLPRAAPEPGLAARARARESLLVHV